MSERPILYSFWQSSCSWRVRIALAYKGIDYECKDIDLYSNKQLEDTFSSINPTKFVPVLTHKGNNITESLAILEYLEEAFPDTPKLLPNDLYERSVARSLSLNIISSIQPLQNERATSYHAPGNRPEQIKMANHFMNLGFKFLEKRLQTSSGKHAVGNQLTFADLCIVPQVYNGVVAYGGVRLDDYPTIKHVFESALELDVFWVSHPYRQPACPNQLQKDELKSKGFLLEEWPDRSKQTEQHEYKSR